MLDSYQRHVPCNAPQTQTCCPTETQPPILLHALIVAVLLVAILLVAILLATVLLVAVLLATVLLVAVLLVAIVLVARLHALLHAILVRLCVLLRAAAVEIG